MPRLRSQLTAAPRAATKLWLAVAESAAVERFELVRELCKQLRPFGVQVGLDHAGERLARIGNLVELGLDKDMDLTVVVDVEPEERVRRLVASRGLAEDDARARIARQTEPRATSARYDRKSGRIIVELTNGCTFAFPPRMAQGLEKASDDELATVEILGAGYPNHDDHVHVRFEP